MILGALINYISVFVSTNTDISLKIAEPIYILEHSYYENPMIEIPKVNLKQEVYPKDPVKNNVDKNIQVIEGSEMPDIDKSNLILASHSGSSSIAYFKHLDQLTFNDEFYIYYKNKKYKYVIGDIYDVEKNGYVAIKRDRSKTAATLITCKKNTNKQTVFIGYLVTSEKTP